MREVRETMTHLMSLNRFEDVQVFQEPAGAGVRLRYVLFPLHPVDRIEFRGTLGLSEDDSAAWSPSASARAPAAGAPRRSPRRCAPSTATAATRRREVTPRIEETHNPDRATLVFDDRRRARARRSAASRWTRSTAASRARRRRRADPRSASRTTTTRSCASSSATTALLHARGFYEARAIHSVRLRAGRHAPP